MLDHPATVLRWHVARLHDRSPSDRGPDGEVFQPWLELVVAPATSYLPDELCFAAAPDRDLAERLEWWVADEDALLYGWASEEAMIARLAQSPITTGAGPLFDIPRRVTEDMVFLQTIENREALDHCWRELKADEGFPSLDPLMDVSELWCDFTKPARRMAKTIYKQALREDDVPGTEKGDAAKR